MHICILPRSISFGGLLLNLGKASEEAAALKKLGILASQQGAGWTRLRDFQKVLKPAAWGPLLGGAGLTVSRFVCTLVVKHGCPTLNFTHLGLQVVLSADRRTP